MYRRLEVILKLVERLKSPLEPHWFVKWTPGPLNLSLSVIQLIACVLNPNLFFFIVVKSVITDTDL